MPDKKVEFEKPVKSIDELIDLMGERWLTIIDRWQCAKILTHVWYFRLSWYLKYFQCNKDEDWFNPWTTFSQVYKLYQFDRELRLVTLDAIEKIEVSLRAAIWNHLTQKYWVFWIYEDEMYYKDWINYWKVKTRIDESVTKLYKDANSLYISSFKEKYISTKVPSRMLIEDITLWVLSSVYRILDKKDAQSISDIYKVYSTNFKTRLHLINTIRNICAHHSRLRNRKYITRLPRQDRQLWDKFQTITLEKYDEYWNNYKSNEVIPNYYNFMLVANYMLNEIDWSWNKFVNKINDLLKRYKSVDLKSMWLKWNRKSNFLNIKK